MSEFKAGNLNSGLDKTVKKRKQAIAIGLAMDYKAHGKKSKKLKIMKIFFSMILGSYYGFKYHNGMMIGKNVQ